MKNIRRFLSFLSHLKRCLLNVGQHMSLFEMGSLIALCAALGFEYGLESKTAGGELWLALALGISSGIGTYYFFYITAQFFNKRILHDNGINPKWWEQYCFTLLPFATWVGVFTAVFLVIKITLAVFH